MFRALLTASPQQFRDTAVDHIMKVISDAFDDHGSCIVGLSGGRTPRAVYEELGVRFQVLGVRFWKRVRFFLIDERYVPPDHPESNQRLVREALLKNLPIPEEHLIFPNTTLPIDICIADYTHRLKELWKNRLPDLIVLGMGTDGHTASLFPPLSDLALGDERLVLHTQTDSHPIHDRITMSLNAISAAGEQVLLLQGKEKQKTWEEMIASPENERRWPLKRIIETGNLTVFAD